jgi:hypothetical protein
VHLACRSCRSRISPIWTPIWTFHIWSLICSTRPIQWSCPNCILWTLTTPVWPVGPIGLTGQTRPANFGCEQLDHICLGATSVEAWGDASGGPWVRWVVLWCALSFS